MATSVDLARQLLGAAVDDELMARSLLPVEGVTDAGIGFHCQQAAEKALKAVLAAKGIEFPFIHDLEYLRELCKSSLRYSRAVQELWDRSAIDTGWHQGVGPVRCG